MLKYLIMVLSILTFFGVFALAQDKPDTEMKEKHGCMKDSSGCCAKHESHSEMKMEDSKETVSAVPWNKVCPVKGEEVDAEAPTFEYDGKVIGFCCPGCDSKFQKDPEKYLKNLNADGTDFIGS